MSKLVIVESPAKAKTIGKYLGKDYEVTASMGHIRKFIHRKMQKHRGHISRKYTDSPVLSG